MENAAAENLSQNETLQISRVALRLPPFWKSNVKLWLLQCDSSFTLAHITADETKYAALVSSIDSETLSHVSDLILHPPREKKYETLSERLIAEFGDTEHQKIKKLLTDLHLGDDKPSQLLRKMRELSAGQLNDDFLQNLWLQRLPSQIQTVLSASSEPLPQLANIADKVAEIAQPTAVYATSCVPDVTPSTSYDFATLSHQITQLASQVERLSRARERDTVKFRRQPNSRHRSLSSSRFQQERISSKKQDGSSALCFYHKRFGERALKCREPCDFFHAKKN